MNNQVKEIVFTGPDGKLVGKYKKGQSLNPPIALLIHPHPLYGGTMNNPIVMNLFSIFDSLGFSIFRFNLRYQNILKPLKRIGKVPLNILLPPLKKDSDMNHF